eukprot:Opistho-2@62095
MRAAVFASLLAMLCAVTFAAKPIPLVFTPITTNAPQQLHVSLGSDPSQIVVRWITTTNASSTLKVGTKSGNYGSVFQGTAPTTYSVSGYKSGFIHFAVATGLTPATTYYYVCGSDDGGYSAEHHFSTAPGSDVPVVIGVIGDLGTTDHSNATVYGLMGDPAGLHLVMHVGDLSYANDDEKYWDFYGSLVEPVSSNVPWMVAAGNHENYYSFAAYKNRFQMPSATGAGGNFYYSFDYSFVHFVILSTETDYSASSAQFKWVVGDLASVDRKATPWVILVWHRPVYNSNTAHEGEGDEFKSIYEDTLFKYKVDIVLCGHVHAYERSLPVYKESTANSPPTQYFTVGDGGNQEGLASGWKNPQPAWSAVRIAKYGFVRMSVANQTHIEWSWFINPAETDGQETLGDHLWIERPYPR